METKNTYSLDQLTDRLKNEDTKYARLSKSFVIVYSLFIPLYLFLMVKDYKDTGDVHSLFQGGIMAASMACFIVIFSKYHKRYNTVDYSLPVAEMLKQAAYRYKPFQKETFWVFTAVVLMDIGLSLNSFSDVDFLTFQLIFIGVMALSIGVGLLLWKVKYKPLRDNALHLLKELEV